MNRIITQAIAIGLMIGAFGAQAIYVPGWDRPIAQASLQEFDNTGHEVGIGYDKTLTLNRMDGAKETGSSFVFAEEMKVFCITAPCNPITQSAKFKVIAITNDGCGSKVFTAQEVVRPGRDLESDPFVRMLKVVDHSTRLCEDYRPFMWEAELTAVGNSQNVRYFRGNPEPINTIR